VSVSDVSTRIAQIQDQIAALSGSSTGASSAANAAAFSSAMAGAETGSTDPTAAVTGSTDATLGDGAQGTSAGQSVVNEAKKYLGIPYVWGGTNPKTGLDCSGLVQLVYHNLGIDLPRVSYQQARAGTAVPSLAQAKPGDLLAFGSPVHHIAIYIGDGKMIEAPHTGEDVRISKVYETPTAIRRILPSGSTATSPAAGAAPVAAGSGSLRAGTPYASLFENAGAKYGVPASLLAAVAHQESGFNAGVTSRAGAQGLMQLMPATAKGLGVNAMNPAQAVDGAARMLRSLVNEFGRVDYALAAYNAGPGAVHRYHGIPPYSETRRYVPAVLGYQKQVEA
jgi:cell wall-associated NlpC family hydrolase